MKKIIFFFFVLIHSLTYSQITVSRSYIGKLDEFEKERFADFKKTTTIFILSNIYEKEEYEKILKTSWTVTPFQVVAPEDFDVKNYLDGKYSFAQLNASKVDQDITFFVRFQIDFFMLNIEKINEKLNSKKKLDEDDFSDLISKNRKYIGIVKLFANGEILNVLNKGFISSTVFRSNFRSYIRTTYKYKESDPENNNPARKSVSDYVFEDEIFRNYTLGMLQNNFQKINTLLNKEEFYWLYGADATKEVKNLKKEILYIPDYVKIRYNPNKFVDENWDETKLNQILEVYKYKYQFITKAELDKKILNNENFYYLRYVKENSEKFFHIVNGKTGEVIYRDYDAGMSEYNIKDDDFKKLMKSINTSK